MKWTVDRIEGSYAVIEFDGTCTADIPVAALPKGVKEGDVISVLTDYDETEKRKEKAENLAKKLFK